MNENQKFYQHLEYLNNWKPALDAKATNILANSKLRSELEQKERVKVLDCGTGTGFVAKQAAACFPDAKIVALDLLDGMLSQARKNCKAIASHVIHIKADIFALPLADSSVDLVLAQNTIPNFEDFARICRPNGMVIFVDCSAGWIAGLAKHLVEKNKLFKKVLGERVALGFYILAQNH